MQPRDQMSLARPTCTAMHKRVPFGPVAASSNSNLKHWQSHAVLFKAGRCGAVLAVVQQEGAIAAVASPHLHGRPAADVVLPPQDGLRRHVVERAHLALPRNGRRVCGATDEQGRAGPGGSAALAACRRGAGTVLSRPQSSCLTSAAAPPAASPQAAPTNSPKLSPPDWDCHTPH